jgi:hypothetical protein
MHVSGLAKYYQVDASEVDKISGDAALTAGKHIAFKILAGRL